MLVVSSLVVVLYRIIKGSEDRVVIAVTPLLLFILVFYALVLYRRITGDYQVTQLFTLISLTIRVYTAGTIGVLLISPRCESISIAALDKIRMETNEMIEEAKNGH